MKFYHSWDWILLALPEFSAIAGLLQRWWHQHDQAFRMRAPPTARVDRCRMSSKMAGRLYPLSCLSVVGMVCVFLFPLLPWPSSAMYWTLLPVNFHFFIHVICDFVSSHTYVFSHCCCRFSLACVFPHSATQCFLFPPCVFHHSPSRHISHRWSFFF